MSLAGQRVGGDRGQFDGNKLEYHAKQEEELRKGKGEEGGSLRKLRAAAVPVDVGMRGQHGCGRAGEERL